MHAIHFIIGSIFILFLFGLLYMAFKHTNLMVDLDTAKAKLSIKETFYKQRFTELLNRLGNLHDGITNLKGKRGTIPSKYIEDIDAEFIKIKHSLSSLIDNCK